MPKLGVFDVLKFLDTSLNIEKNFWNWVDNSLVCILLLNESYSLKTASEALHFYSQFNFFTVLVTSYSKK